jgi:hypothetical protein
MGTDVIHPRLAFFPKNIMQIFLLLPAVLGQRWHTVNDYDLDGQVCNINYQQVSCPVVCVESPTKCPVPLLPDTCPEGSFYCRDGGCHIGPSQEFACHQIKSK